MPGIFQPDNLPAWMNPTGFILESPSHVGAAFESSFNLASQNNSAINKLRVKEAENNLKLQNVQLNNTLADNTTIPEWLKDHPTWESRQTSEWPVALSPEGQQQLRELRLRDSQNIQMETAVAATHDFATRVAKLRELDPESAGQFAPYISQRPTPEVLKDLAVVEQAARLHQQNIAENARLEAESAGAQARTVIGPKGVTTTYTVPKPGENTTTEPRTMSLGNGRSVVWMPGAKTLHVVDDKTGDKKELTPLQLGSIAKGLDDDDPRKKQITDFLAETAVKQTRPTSAAPASTPTQSQPNEVSAADKAALANQIAKDNPDLTREQIIERVEQHFSGQQIPETPMVPKTERSHILPQKVLPQKEIKPIPGITPPVSKPVFTPGRRVRTLEEISKEGAQIKSQRIEYLTNLLKKANTGRGTFMSSKEYMDKYEELSSLVNE